MKNVVCSIGLVLLSGAVVGGIAEEKRKTRDEMVHDDRSAFGKSEHWIYNDLEKGFAEAKQSGKPMIVVHRCIP